MTKIKIHPPKSIWSYTSKGIGGLIIYNYVSGRLLSHYRSMLNYVFNEVCHEKSKGVT